MTTPYYQDDSVTLHHGDALEVLRTMPDQSVDCCVTSPPYFGLRDYGEEGQYGLEASPAEYVETMRALFAEVRRVLTDDGTLWLNIGDTYYSGKGAAVGQDKKQPARRGYVRPVDKAGVGWSSPKNLLGIPWRVAFALQDDGWIIRNDIIWAKPNAMPESVTDRLSTRHEHLFMLSKSRTYWFDLNPIREPVVKGAAGSEFHTGKTGEHQLGRASKRPREAWGGIGSPQPRMEATGERHTYTHDDGRNPGDVWTIPTTPFPGAHFAVFPPALAERCVVAGCKPGGTVLDPFSGSGTTGMVAGQAGRRYVGIDLSRDYLDLSLRTRLAQSALIDTEATA